MQTTIWHLKHHRHSPTLDRRGWVFLAGLAGALYACITPLFSI